MLPMWRRARTLAHVLDVPLETVVLQAAFETFTRCANTLRSMLEPVRTFMGVRGFMNGVVRPQINCSLLFCVKFLLHEHPSQPLQICAYSHGRISAAVPFNSSEI